MATLKEKYKLPKAFKTKWIKALRSGKYEQGRGYLFRNGSYCCLGVAGELCGLNKLDYFSYLRECNFINDTTFTKVPKAIKGLPCENPLVKKLTSMNDNGKSFKYIASYIERYL